MGATKYYHNFSGKLSFKKPVTDRELDMFPPKIGGDQADIEDFFIYDDGSFDGTLMTFHDDLTPSDVENFFVSILTLFDENTNKIINTITEFKI